MTKKASLMKTAALSLVMLGLLSGCASVSLDDDPAGKKAAALVLGRQKKLDAALTSEARTTVAIAAAVGEDPADCWPILCHLAANGRARRLGAPDPKTARFQRA